MSTVTKTITITCPQCGATGEAPIWDEIDAQQTRRDARHVLNETLFEVKCNQCNHKSSLNYPLIYHDGDLRFIVQYVMNDNALEAAKRSISETARSMRAQAARLAALSDKASEEEADAAAAAVMADPDALEGYRFRIVTTRNDLREKIVILRNSLDDRAIEVLKITTFNLAAAQGKLKGATKPFFGGVKKSGDILIDFVGGRRHREMKIPVELYAKVCEDIVSFAQDINEAPVVDETWAERFLAHQEKEHIR